MTTALLATGDEIVHGDTLNTNSQYIAKALSSEGISLGLHMSCSDKEKDMVNCLNFLKQSHDTIIITGGLGPTSDDRTRYALASSIQQPLIEYPDAVKHIKDRLSPGRIVLNAGNMQQALFPANAQLLANPHGSALGCFGLWEETLFILLPGPPAECLPMFNDYILPLLQKKQHSNKQLLKWLIFGFAESELAEKLDAALADLDCQTGYRLDIPYIEFKARCKPALVNEIRERIESLIGEQIISPANKKASAILKEKISQLQKPIAIIDEVSGGRLQTLIDSPETHELISFYPSEDAVLSFHLTGLNAYWEQKAKGSPCHINIHCQSKNFEATETKDLAYRSNHVIQSATEWLCFRMSHFIDKFHQ